jgi:hypothetical protein
MLNRNLPRMIVGGHGRHGKDTFCEYLYPLNFESSSNIACSKVVYPVLAEKYNYASVMECYNDRHNHREEWYNLIAEYNTPDKARLSRDIFRESNIYCGIRDREEFLAAKKDKLFDLAIWIDASKRVSAEPSSSITVTKDMFDIIVDNNSTQIELFRKARNLKSVLRLP